MSIATLQDDLLAQLESVRPIFRLFDALPDVYFFLKNARGEFVAANQATLQALGLTDESQMLGKTDYDVVPSELAAEFREQDRRIHLTGRPIRNDVQLVPDRSGTLKWYLVTKLPLLSESRGVVGVAVLMRDVSSAGAALLPYHQITPVIEFILHNYQNPISVREMACESGMSVRQFERRFKSLFHITPLVYVNRYRVQKACWLLRNTDRKITQVAQDVGAYDSSHFIRQFRRFMGITPMQYRKRLFEESQLESRPRTQEVQPGPRAGRPRSKRSAAVARERR